MFVEVTPEEVENCTKYDRYQDHSCSGISHVASKELSSKLNGKIIKLLQPGDYTQNCSLARTRVGL
jgi:hypothetical protein